jgi:hypothetical protein
MADQPQPPVNQRFKAEMPQIPGVSASGTANRSGGSGSKFLVLGGIFAVLIAIALGGKLLSRPRRADAPAPPTPQADTAVNRELPIPPAIDSDAPIAQVGDLAKPWDARQFTFHNKVTGENVQALLLRLPTGSAGQTSGYWALAMRPAYGNCRLDYLQDLDKLRTDYGYAQARHPAVTNPCTHTVYDPTKYASLPGGVLARGAIVQGTDLRPPLGIEIKIRGKDILAIRME